MFFAQSYALHLHCNNLHARVIKPLHFEAPCIGNERLPPIGSVSAFLQLY